MRKTLMVNATMILTVLFVAPIVAGVFAAIVAILATVRTSRLATIRAESAYAVAFDGCPGDWTALTAELDASEAIAVRVAAIAVDSSGFLAAVFAIDADETETDRLGIASLATDAAPLHLDPSAESAFRGAALAIGFDVRSAFADDYAIVSAHRAQRAERNATVRAIRNHRKAS